VAAAAAVVVVVVVVAAAEVAGDKRNCELGNLK
jgi:hypothetical protein